MPGGYKEKENAIKCFRKIRKFAVMLLKKHTFQKEEGSKDYKLKNGKEIEDIKKILL